MYTLKSIARRGTMLGAVGALLVSAVVPAVPAFAAELNPLTERSLLLSSSAPGYVDTDGSGYSTTVGNPAAGGNTPGTYAPAGSGPNGKKSGQTFTFRASSRATVKSVTFQYCTTAAGLCQAPGNNTGDARTPSPDNRQDNDGVGGGWESKTSDLDVKGTFTQSSGPSPAAGEFQVSVQGAQTGASDWVMSSVNQEDPTFAHPTNNRLTGKKNLIKLTSAAGQLIEAGERVKIQFTASESNFITNPGSGSFFVKINTFSDESATTKVDGGVTVANVMTDSIHITTKVLETMAFSVGIENPDTTVKSGWANHGTCEAIDQGNNNRIDLGNPSAENSLETGRGWDAFSYWRLSSNSSGGATVYYSGNTLSNTVGDQIAAMTTKTNSQPGKEQFGLGFVDIARAPVDSPTGNENDDRHGDKLSTTFNQALAQPETRYKAPSSFPFITAAGQEGTGVFAGLAAQPVSTDYRDASGTLDNGSGGQGTAEFKFNPASITVPEPIAQQSEQVISCATAKMRYVGNIAADTPAGVYTTKINYLAAPQY